MNELDYIGKTAAEVRAESAMPLRVRSGNAPVRRAGRDRAVVVLREVLPPSAAQH
jgi:hypothetical protein